MPSNQTPNYQLSQWVKSDQVKMEDFNADNVKLDGALKAQAETLSGLNATISALQNTVAGKQDSAGAVKITAGSYTGNGSASRTVSVGFTPKAVLVMNSQGNAGLWTGSGYSTFGGLAVTGKPVIWTEKAGYVCVEIVSGGFRVYQKEYSTNVIYSNCNLSGTSYHYLAIG